MVIPYLEYILVVIEKLLEVLTFVGSVGSSSFVLFLLISIIGKFEGHILARV